jgi:hypothetical protein
MSNSMTLITLVTNKTLTKYYVDGIVFYRPNSKKFKYFDLLNYLPDKF